MQIVIQTISLITFTLLIASCGDEYTTTNNFDETIPTITYIETNNGDLIEHHSRPVYGRSVNKLIFHFDEEIGYAIGKVFNYTSGRITFQDRSLIRDLDWKTHIEKNKVILYQGSDSGYIYPNQFYSIDLEYEDINGNSDKIFIVFTTAP